MGAAHARRLALGGVERLCVAVAILNGAETEALALDVQRAALHVLQGEDGSIEVGLFSVPWFDALDAEGYLRLVAGHGGGRAGGHLLSFAVDDIDSHRTAWQGAVQEHVGHEPPVAFRVDGHATDVAHWLSHDKHRPPDAAEVPVVGAAFGQVDLRYGALLEDLHLEAVFLLSKEHTVADVDGMPRKAALVGAVAGLTTVYLHANLGEGSLEDQLNLPALPLLRQRKLRLVATRLVGNALGRGLAVEAHAVLVGAEALQFPARGHSYLGPLAAVVSVGTIEVPFYHVVASVSAEVLSLSLLCNCVTDGQQVAGQ